MQSRTDCGRLHPLDSTWTRHTWQMANSCLESVSIYKDFNLYISLSLRFSSFFLIGLAAFETTATSFVVVQILETQVAASIACGQLDRRQHCKYPHSHKSFVQIDLM